MKRMLNKQILMDRYGIKDVSLDGLLITKENGNYISQCESRTKHTNGKTKTYYFVNVFDKVTSKQTQLLVHNIVYAWFNDDYDIYMDIDHIDNDSLNNKLDNLQQIDRKSNLAKDCDRREQQLRTNEIKRQKIASGDYVQVHKCVYDYFKKNTTRDCFSYTQHHHFVKKY